ncbi:condensation domain-containing protein, partial [Actinomadura adrarensis]
MSAIRDFIEQLNLDGVQLWVQDGKLRYRSAGELHSDQLEAMRERREEVIAAIQGDTPMRASRPATVPLSLHQQGMWFLQQSGSLGPAYNVTKIHRIAGDLDIDALRKAIGEIVRRHEILRTRFPAINGVGVQIVESADGEQSFELVDISHLDSSAKASRLAAMRSAYNAHRFDLAEERAFRAELVRLAPEDHLLAFRFHHIVIDGRSTANFFQELQALYAAFRAGRPSPLPDLPLQYADYSVWQRDWLRAEDLENHLQYWRNRLGDAPASLDLPFDRPRSASTDGASDIVRVPVPLDLAAGLRNLAQREGATLFMVLLTALHTLLARWSGQTDVCVGLAVEGRNHPDFEANIGNFINTVVLRADLSGRPPFRELLHQVRERLVEAYDHRHVPIDRLVAELRPSRDLSMQPLFQVLCTHLVTEAGSTDLDGLAVTSMEPDEKFAMFDLMLYAAEVGDELEIGFEYATDLFDRTTIQRLGGFLETLLEGVVAAPGTSVTDLLMLSEPQRHELLETWNDTAFGFEHDRCLHDLVEAQAARTPEATAITFEGQRLSYRELNGRANALAEHIQGLGVGPDATVGIRLPRSPELVIAVLAVMKAGGACVPMDP